MIFKEPEKTFSKTWVVCVCALFCCVLWGSAFPCVKLGYSLFQINTSFVPSIILFAGMRFSLAGVLVIIFGSITRKRFLLPKPKNWWRVGVVAIFQTAFQYTFYYIGLASTAGVKASVLNGLGVFFTIIAACFFFRTEKFNLIKFAGCILGFGGIVLINLSGEFNFNFSLRGEGFIIFSGLSAAFAAGFVKIFAKSEDTTAICGWQFFCGGILLAVTGLAAGGKITYIDVGAAFMLLYLAFLSACAFTVQSFLLRYNPVSKVAVFKSSNPIFGAIFSALILGEKDQLFNIYTLLSLLLVCTGIFVINKFGEKKPKIKKTE